jgi:pimeloyl-ACP methyl ester carboxylesterase
MRAAGLGALSCFRFDARAATRRIAVPTLLLTGDCDVNMPPAIQKRMAARLSDPETVIIPDCGHLCLLERHEEVSTILRDFAQRCLGVSAGPRPR